MMNRCFTRLLASLVIGLASLALGPRAAAATNAPALHFPVLTLANKAYTNATVTQREATYVILVHAGGIESLKLADLPPAALEKLGYRIEPPKTNSLAAPLLDWFARRPAAQAGTNAASDPSSTNSLAPAWLTRQEPAVLQELRLKYSAKLAAASRWSLAGGAGAVAAAYFFFCYCCRRLCQQAGKRAGALIWLPLLKTIPLLRAADMSPAWVLLWLVPGLNFIVWVLWSIRMVRVLGHGPLLTGLLILPPTSALAFLYLAFARSEPSPVLNAKPAEKAPSMEFL